MDSMEDTGISKVIKDTPLISPHYLSMMAGRMMPLLALFGATILYAHQLPSASYAIFQSIWMYVNIVSVIIGFGITTVIFSSQATELARFIKENKRSIIFFYSLLWIITLTIFAFVSHQYTFTLKIWVIVFMMVQASNTILETWLIKNNGEVQYFLVNTIYGITFFIWHYQVLHSGFDIVWLIKGIVFFAFAKFILLIIFPRRLHDEKPEKRITPTLLSHWTYNGMNDIISILSKWIDKLILIYLLTPSEFAIFFNGSIEIPLLAIFISFTGSLMMVQMSNRTKENQSVIPVFRENFLLLSTIIFPVFFFFLFFSVPIFHIIFGAQYEKSVPIFLITILILPLRINNFGAIMQVMGKGKIITFGSVIDLILCMLLVLILYPLFGMRGAAMAIVISTGIQISYYLWQSKRLLQTTFNDLIPVRALITRFLIVGFLFWILYYFIQIFSPIANIISGCILILACIVATGNRHYRQIPGRNKSL